jgi:replicative DNA helicase Mcm
MIKGGALVRADGGICALDELDKLPEEERAGLLQSMQDGRINSDKADISAEMPAFTGIIAGANPKHGRYDDYESVAEQFGLSSALVNRFDLRYAPKDIVDAEEDKKKALHLLNEGEKTMKKAASESPEEEEIEYDVPLGKEELRAYIAYARRLQPTVCSEEGKEWASENYHRLRKMSSGAIPVNLRQCAAVHRLPGFGLAAILAGAGITAVKRHNRLGL